MSLIMREGSGIQVQRQIDSTVQVFVPSVIYEVAQRYRLQDACDLLILMHQIPGDFSGPLNMDCEEFRDLRSNYQESLRHFVSPDNLILQDPNRYPFGGLRLG